jgi:hypothetical protein
MFNPIMYFFAAKPVKQFRRRRQTRTLLGVEVLGEKREKKGDPADPARFLWIVRQ